METTTEAGRPTHAPYGKACLNCVKSKTRCAGSDSEAKCERFVLLSIQLSTSLTLSLELSCMEG
jgi:hypothetical protein